VAAAPANVHKAEDKLTKAITAEGKKRADHEARERAMRAAAVGASRGDPARAIILASA
jgi:hypothetical protein